MSTKELYITMLFIISLNNSCINQVNEKLLSGKIVEFTTGVQVTDKYGNFIGQYEYCGDETDGVIITNDTIISAFIVLDNGDSIVAHNITDFCGVSFKPNSRKIRTTEINISCSYINLDKNLWRSINLCEYDYVYTGFENYIDYNEDHFKQVLLKSCYLTIK